MGMSAIRPKPDLLDSDYREALAAYVAYGGEALLARGYELGRKALADGRSIPELVGVHSRALRTLASDERAPGDPGLLIDSAETFLAETLSPFEMTHRGRSEEHTSELQSRVDLVCRLLLEKKKKK